MIDEPFRTKIDELDEALLEYSNVVGKIRRHVIPEIFQEGAKRHFELDANVKIQLSIKAGNASYGVGSNLINLLLKGEHPKEEVQQSNPEFSRIDTYEFQTEDGRVINIHELDRFDEFWNVCVARTEQHPSVLSCLEEKEKLLLNARKLKQELAKRIQAPWKI